MKIRQRPALRALWRGPSVRAAVTFAAVVAIAPASALAAKVSGSPQAVSIEAQNSSIEEILAALGHDFNVHYHSLADLKSQITGTYQGSLQRVLSRILEGYNFVVKSNSDGGVDVTVLGRRNAPATGGSTTAAAAAPVTAKNGSAPKSPPSGVAQQPDAAPSASGSVPAVPKPEIKLAEGTAPVPTPTPSSKALPSPTPDTTTLVAPPMPTPGSTANLPVPEVRPSTAVPPVPPSPPPSSAAANGPNPPASTTQTPADAPNAAESKAQAPAAK